MGVAKEKTKKEIFNSRHQVILGFTIVELLVAAACTVIVIPAAFSFMFTLARQDQNLIKKNLQQEEMNRALSFLQTEGRSATRVITFHMDGSDIYEIDWRAGKPRPDLFLVSANTNVACLKPPHIPLFKFSLSNSSVPAYYSIRELDSSVSSLWTRPYGIYRCGPALKADGTYGEDATGHPKILLDGISAPASLNCIPDLESAPSTCNPDSKPGIVFTSICKNYPDHHPPEVRNFWPDGRPGNSHQELEGGVRVCVSKLQNGIAIRINRLASTADGISNSSEVQLETYTAMRSLP